MAPGECRKHPVVLVPLQRPAVQIPPDICCSIAAIPEKGLRPSPEHHALVIGVARGSADAHFLPPRQAPPHMSHHDRLGPRTHYSPTDNPKAIGQYGLQEVPKGAQEGTQPIWTGNLCAPAKTPARKPSSKNGIANTTPHNKGVRPNPSEETVSSSNIDTEKPPRAGRPSDKRPSTHPPTETEDKGIAQKPSLTGGRTELVPTR